MEPPSPLPPPLPGAAPPRVTAPFLLPCVLLGGFSLLASGAMLSTEFWPRGMGWVLFLASVGCLLMTLWPRRVDAADPAGASFHALAATVLVTLMVGNALVGAMRSERTYESFATVGFPAEADLALLRPAESVHTFAFRSPELQSELRGLEGAEVRVRLRVTRSFGKIRRVDLLEVAGKAWELRALGMIEHREQGGERRIRLNG